MLKSFYLILLMMQCLIINTVRKTVLHHFDSKYGRTVHLAMKDNPRLINIPPRDSEQWKKEYNARTSAERSNKREKIDFKLEDGRHRSSKMWYCRLYHILMLQHLDAWDLPFESTLRKLILNVA